MAIQIILCVFFSVILCSEGIDCPKTLPHEIEGNCYAFKATPLSKFEDAMNDCQNMGENVVLISVRSEAVLDRIRRIVYEYITKKLDGAAFWIGLFMKDQSYGKALKDRNWKWTYDDTEIIQKDYSFWETEEGPTEDGLTCTTINTKDYLVKAVDCGGARLPFVCMKKEGEECKDKGPPSYLMYDDYCLGAGTMATPKGYELDGACSGSNEVTPYKDEAMKNSVKMAVKNAFLGGGVYMNMKREGDRFIDLSDRKEVNPDWWEPGEPRNQYDCVGLSLQPDNTLKYKTMDCEFLSAFFCAYNSSEKTGKGEKLTVM